MVDDTVTIPKAYLEELEKKVDELKKAENERKGKTKKSLESLYKYKAEHGPGKKSTERVKRHVELHREEYNARRRERYRLKKEAEKKKADTDTS